LHWQPHADTQSWLSTTQAHTYVYLAAYPGWKRVKKGYGSTAGAALSIQDISCITKLFQPTNLPIFYETNLAIYYRPIPQFLVCIRSVRLRILNLLSQQSQAMVASLKRQHFLNAFLGYSAAVVPGPAAEGRTQSQVGAKQQPKYRVHTAVRSGRVSSSSSKAVCTKIAVQWVDMSRVLKLPTDCCWGQP
jgi:hypothetical protein